jgi:hypothetical protein
LRGRMREPRWRRGHRRERGEGCPSCLHLGRRDRIRSRCSRGQGEGVVGLWAWLASRGILGDRFSSASGQRKGRPVPGGDSRGCHWCRYLRLDLFSRG